jgi:hypothetical protein
MAQEAAANQAYGGDGTIDLRATGGDPCATWIDTGNRPAGPNCFGLRRAEQRFVTATAATRQRAAPASRALDLNNDCRTSSASRRVRLGVEINF